MSDHANPRWHAFPADLADRCVKCAQCLPHCPTWRLDHDETDSPRGRIALMQAAAAGTVADDGPVRMHLDRCLGCRHCEAVCPADVPYGELIDAANAAMRAPGHRGPWRVRLLRALIVRWRLFRTVVLPMLRWFAETPLRRLPGPGVYERTGRVDRGDAWLFLGCVARALDSETLAVAHDALRDAGYRVRVPDGQVCCGALHLHAGDAATHRRFAETNAAAFAGSGPIVTCASGCAATLRDDPRLGARVTDISALLADVVEPLATDGVVIHTPCTLAAVQAQADAPGRLLSGARMAPWQGRCCGAAGDYFLREPAIAERLRDETLDGLAGARTVCTSNIGCALYLRAGFAARGLTVVVRHPLVEWSAWKR